MMTYIAMLRGINVGRGKMVKMERLRTLFAGLGFVASPITQFAAAGGRELSETITALTLIIRVRLTNSVRDGHGAVREMLRLLR